MKKRSIKKVLALGLAGAMLCGMLTACGGANGSSSAPSASSEGQAEPAAPETEKEKVVLWHLWTGVEAGYLDDAVAAYNAQSDKYYVEALSVPDSQKIMVAIQSGDGPDITDDFTNNIGAYASKGIMLPLDDYIAKNNTDLSDIIPSTLEACKYEGKTYALPAGMNLMALFYNKTLLAEAGYTEPPKTMEEMYEMAVNTTKLNPDGTIDVMGYPDFPSVYYTDNFAAALGGGWYDENGKPAEFTIKAISTRENEEIRNSCTYEVPVKGKPGVFRNKVNTNEYIAKMISACVVEPSLFDIDLQNSYGVSKPEELIKEMIDNPAEYDDFAVFVQSYNGFDISLSEKVEQAKNS